MVSILVAAGEERDRDVRIELSLSPLLRVSLDALDNQVDLQADREDVIS
nr:hypothetical protein [Gemmatimonadales bacterium]